MTPPYPRKKIKIKTKETSPICVARILTGAWPHSWRCDEREALEDKLIYKKKIVPR